MDAVKTTRELCDYICRNNQATEAEAMLARQYRDLHDAARIALVALKAYAGEAPASGAVQEVIDDLEKQLVS